MNDDTLKLQNPTYVVREIQQINDLDHLVAQGDEPSPNIYTHIISNCVLHFVIKKKLCASFIGQYMQLFFL
jgi:hypothetical protein